MDGFGKFDIDRALQILEIKALCVRVRVRACACVRMMTQLVISRYGMGAQLTAGVALVRRTHRQVAHNILVLIVLFSLSLDRGLVDVELRQHVRL